ncbi:MAG TPA: hypothetical protein PLG75_00470 [Methanoculleus sp.]|nr:hypothetical protein [Methanoculleus sp.]
MNLQKGVDLQEKDTGIPSPETPGRDGGLAAVMQQNRTKLERWRCDSCTYYDPERAYCTHIHTPIAILFVCPQTLDSRS